MTAATNSKKLRKNLSFENFGSPKLKFLGSFGQNAINEKKPWVGKLSVEFQLKTL